MVDRVETHYMRRTIEVIGFELISHFAELAQSVVFLRLNETELMGVGLGVRLNQESKTSMTVPNTYTKGWFTPMTHWFINWSYLLANH